MTQPTGTVTFVFTDIEDSTGLWERAPSSMRTAVERHDEMVRAAMGERGGLVFSTSGDGFAVAFQRAGDALAAAIAAQSSLESSSWSADAQIRVRIGIHTGEVHERGGDYFGPAVNRASRIMAAAPPGDILVSASTAGLLESDLRERLVDLGSHQLRGVPEPVALLGVPDDRGKWSGRPLATQNLDHVHLPRPPTEMVGRQAEVSAVLAQLRQRRLITLVGSGGVGKTRLAVEVASLSAGRFVDGVWFVELAPVIDGDGVTAAIAAAVDTHPRDGATFEAALVDHLSNRSGLIVVDNCEHVLSAAAEVIGHVLAGCPRMSVLVTSREALDIDGELVWPVPSLDPDLEGPELFRARMFEMNASSERPAVDDELVSQLCRRLDGIPLAIELAAGQTRMMSVAEIVEHLDDRFSLLRGSSRGRMERHQTLRATVTWSYRLLDPLEQLLFDRFSVFAGGASLEAVASVCSGGELEAEDVFDLLASLVNKSMLVADRSQPRTRFNALETLRQFGNERLESRGELASCRDRHVDYFAEWAGRADAAWTGPRSTFEVPDRREWDNLHTAHQWAIRGGNLDHAMTIAVDSSGLAANWIRPDHLEWLDDTIALADDRGRRVPTAEACRASWLIFAGNLDGAVRSARQSVSEAPAPHDTSTRQAWENMAFASYLQGDSDGMEVASAGLRTLIATGTTPKDEAFALFMLCVVDAAIAPTRAPEHRDRLDQLADEMDSPFLDLLARTARVLASVMAQDPAATTALAAEALSIADEVQSTAFVDAIRGMVSVSYVGTDSPDATRTFRDQLAALYEARDWGVTWWTLEGLASHLVQNGNVELGTVLFGHLDAGGHSSRAAFDGAMQLVSALPERDALMARGAAISPDEMVHQCLAHLDHQLDDAS
jgi:predicted ATPase/class 3 adenylate cyclase